MNKWKKRRGLSIKFKVIFVICFVAFTIICVDTVISYMNDYNLLRRIISEESQEIANQLSSAVARIVNEEIVDLKIHTSNLTWIDTIVSENLMLENKQADKRIAYFAEMDKQWQASADESDLVKKYTENAIAEELKSIMEKDKNIAEILVTNRFGGLVAASAKTTDFYQADEEWCEQLFRPNAEEVYVIGVKHDESSNTLSFVLAAQITDRSDNIIGAYKIVLHAKRVLAPVADFKFKETGHAVLVNRDGLMVFHKDFKNLGKFFLNNIEDWRDIRGKVSGTAIVNSPHVHDGNIFISYAKVDSSTLLTSDIEWMVFIGQDIDEVFSPLLLFAAQEISALGILTIVLIVLGFIFGTILIKPINKIVAGIKRIGEGDLDYRIDVRSSDEFGLLADSINAMAGNLKESTASIDTLNKEIEAHKKAELALRESEEKYRLLTENLSDVVIRISSKGVLEYCSPAIKKFGGYNAEEEIGNFITKYFVHKEELLRTVRVLGIILREKKPRNIEFLYKAKNRAPFYVEVTGMPLVEHDKVKAIQCVMRDITKRKKAEQAISDAAEQWQRTFDSITDMIFIQDVEHKIIKANKTMFDMLNKSPEEIIGKQCYEVLHNMNKPWRMCPFEKTKKDKKSHTEEVDDPITGILFSATSSPIFDDKGELTGSVHIFRDITERKKIDQLKDDFISTVSHELRTPLSITKEGISLILDGIPGKINDKQRNILNMSKDNVDRLSRIINDLLDIAKIESGKMELIRSTFSVTALIREIAGIWKFESDKKKQRLAFSIPKKSIDIYADRDKMIEILNNLLSNAIKYTPDKGSIKLDLKDDKDVVWITVSDTGIGISEQDIPKVFLKFQQVNRNVGPGAQGTGLGLSIVKKLVHMHGGTIDVESAANKGAVFKFSIPKKGLKGADRRVVV